jgi:Leucine-rich repeat (LRR) protein
MEFEFNSDESEAAIAERFVQKKSALLLDRIEERVVLKLVAVDAEKLIQIAHSGPSHASHQSPGAVRMEVSIACRSPVLRCIQFYRVTGSGNVSDAAMQMLLMSQCDLRTVWKVKGAEGFGNIWSAAVATPGSGAGASAMHDWSQLRNLNLSHCGLSALPPAVGAVSALRILRVSYNKLSAMPAELQELSELEVLAADHNQLMSIPGGGRRGGRGAKQGYM